MVGILVQLEFLRVTDFHTDRRNALQVGCWDEQLCDSSEAASYTGSHASQANSCIPQWSSQDGLLSLHLSSCSRLTQQATFHHNSWIAWLYCFFITLHGFLQLGPPRFARIILSSSHLHQDIGCPTCCSPPIAASIWSGVTKNTPRRSMKHGKTITPTPQKQKNVVSTE